MRHPPEVSAAMALKAVVFDLNGVIIDDAGWHRGEPHAREGIAQLITELSDSGLLLAVATSGRRATAKEVLTKLGLADRFAVIVGLEDVRLPKPDPEVYRRAVERLAVAPAEAAAIDDSPRGIRAARGAGLTAVAMPPEGSLRFGFGTANLLVDSPSELTLATLVALVDLVSR
jgi:HAD superfamily hydrolase (TIGR01509 family)